MTTCSPGADSDYVDSGCSTAAMCLHLRPRPCVWYAHSHVGPSSDMETRYHSLFTLWEATSYRSPPRALIWPSFWYMRSPLRVIACCDGLPFRLFLDPMPDMI